MTTCERCGSSRGAVRHYLDVPATLRHATLDCCIGALRDDLHAAMSALRALPKSPHVRVDVSDVVNERLRAFADEVALVEHENKRMRAWWAKAKAYAGKPSAPPYWSNPLADLFIEIEHSEDV